MDRIVMAVVLLSFGIAACSNGGSSSGRSAQEASSATSSVKGHSGTVWREGVNYEVISTGRPISDSQGEIEVVEFFWYECPVCYALEPHIVLWNRRGKPTYVRFERVPAAWRRANKVHARLYYTLKELGREDLHELAFDTVHRRGIPLYDDDDEKSFKQQLQFAVSQGIDERAFTNMYHSPTVDADVERAAQLAERYHVQKVPTLVVNGKYLIDLGHTNLNEYQLLEVVSALVVNERKQLSVAKSPDRRNGFADHVQ